MRLVGLELLSADVVASRVPAMQHEALELMHRHGGIAGGVVRLGTDSLLCRNALATCRSDGRSFQLAEGHIRWKSNIIHSLHLD
jgi:hypothetical protein